MDKSRKGFTLIELVIVVAIFVILASLALPAYQNYLQKTRRSDATTSLIRLSLEQARYQADSLIYASSLVALGYSAASVDSDNGYYTITVTQADATTFTATAAPKAGTSQATDTCGTFTVTQAWPAGLTASEKMCWNQG